MSHVLLAEQQLKALLKYLNPKIEGVSAFPSWHHNNNSGWANRVH